MASLNTFGAILSHAIELEAQLLAFYSGIGDSERANAAENAARSWNASGAKMWSKSRSSPLKDWTRPTMRLI